MSKGCAPVWASYSAINRLTSSMSAVSGSYSRRVVSPTGENVRILAFTFGLLQAFFGFLGRVGLVLVILHRVLGLSSGPRNGRLLVQSATAGYHTWGRVTLQPEFDNCLSMNCRRCCGKNL